MANANTLALAAESAEWTLPSRRKVAVICLICTEAALFTIFVVAYLFYIGKSLSGPYPAQLLDVPILATICLLSSSHCPCRDILGLDRLRMAAVDF